MNMDPRRAFFEQLAAEWDAQQPPGRHERLCELLTPFADVWRRADAILDVGSGTGALLAVLRGIAPEPRLIGTDLAHAMLERAAARGLKGGLVQADAHRLPFRASAFDEDAVEHFVAHGETVENRTPAILLAEDVTVRYGSVLALDRVSLVVRPGELIGLFGPNGAGKSSFLKAALGLTPIASGRLTVLGKAVGNRGFGRVRQQIGYVPQKPPNGRLPVTVWEAAALGRYGRVGPGRPLTAHDRALIDNALARLGLTALRDRPVSQLSGGQAQRVGIARALAQEPALLLLDEPTASLDRDGQLELARQVAVLNREAGIAVVIVSHDPAVARLCDRLFFFEAGRARELRRDEELPGYG
jgi:ABC-type Mn2+/Zn2+ transport system ATPase subunit